MHESAQTHGSAGTATSDGADAASQLVEDPVLRHTYRFRHRGDVAVVDIWADAASKLPDHLHPVQEERWEVIEGTVTFYVEGRPQRLGAGGRTVLKPGIRHRFEVSPDAPARMRFEVEPALDIEAFLTEGAALNRSGRYTSHQLPKTLSAALDEGAFLERYKDTVVLLRPPRALQRLMFWLSRLAPRRR